MIPGVAYVDSEVATKWWWYKDAAAGRLSAYCIFEDDDPFPSVGFVIPKQFKPLLRYRDLPVQTKEEALVSIQRILDRNNHFAGHNTEFDVRIIGRELLSIGRILRKPVELDTLKALRKIGRGAGPLNLETIVKEVLNEEKVGVDRDLWHRACNEYEPAAIKEVIHRVGHDAYLHRKLVKWCVAEGLPLF